MPKNLSPGVAMLTMTLLMVTGCADSRDERYSQLAQQALRQQAAQNERLADQSQQIAEASRRLVAGDAEARKDLLDAQEQLTSELHSERAGLDRQRANLERERQNIAALPPSTTPTPLKAYRGRPVAPGFVFALLTPRTYHAHKVVPILGPTR